MASVSEAFRIAVEEYRAGRLSLAEEICCRILAVEPEDADTLHLIGVLAYRVGKYQAAVEHIRRAIRSDAGKAAFHSDLGTVLQCQGKLEEAVACQERALGLDPGFAAAHYNLGNALKQQGRFGDSVACYRRALELTPGDAEIHNNLGVALEEEGKLEEAIVWYRRALELKADCAAASYNMGNCLKHLERLGEAAACYRRALELTPDDAEIHNNLGVALEEQGKLEEAIVSYRRALELNRDYPEAYNNLGNAFKDQGNLEEALTNYRRALEIAPDSAALRSNFLYALNFHPAYDAKTIYLEHRRWNQQFAAPLARLAGLHCSDPSPERRLRIGYVSPDLREHVIGRFLLPLLEAHEHRHFEIFAYSSVLSPDAITERCRTAVDVWRDAACLSDEQLAGAVRQDRIDVLVDLSMHMAHNRMLLFARKPSPIQVTYLAYCGTTGLDTMDYRLTDPYLDPPGSAGEYYSEQSIWLPQTYWCYRPVGDAGPVGSLPALESGRVQFGCLNNFCKVSTSTLGSWARLLRAVPESTILIHARCGGHRQRVQDVFARHGVSPARVTFVNILPLEAYMHLHNRIDVALDPFPYGGGCTSCDALWMGVPVVSLAGGTAVGRSGLSILSTIGLPELVASDAEEYVRIAAELAADRPRLAQLRATLRQRMKSSPLMDAARFARNIESAYREMWRRWCKQQSAPK